MRITIESTGTHDAVNADLRAQLKQARTSHPLMGATLAALTDDLAKRSAHAPGETVTVHADLLIDITVTKPASAADTKADVVGVIVPAIKAPSLASFASPDLKPVA